MQGQGVASTGARAQHLPPLPLLQLVLRGRRSGRIRLLSLKRRRDRQHAAAGRRTARQRLLTVLRGVLLLYERRLLPLQLGQAVVRARLLVRQKVHEQLVLLRGREGCSGTRGCGSDRAGWSGQGATDRQECG